MSTGPNAAYAHLFLVSFYGRLDNHILEISPKKTLNWSLRIPFGGWSRGASTRSKRRLQSCNYMLRMYVNGDVIAKARAPKNRVIVKIEFPR